jgi:hypothetical protein
MYAFACIGSPAGKKMEQLKTDAARQKPGEQHLLGSVLRFVTPLYMPVPVSGTATGVAGAATLTFKFALKGPVELGLNVTLIVQLAPTARVVPQLLVWLKRFAFAPLKLILMPLSVAVPVFVTITGVAGVVVFLA